MNVFVLASAIVIITAYYSSFFTQLSARSPWYNCIKSPITPPPATFSIVWFTLYILIAYALGLSLAAHDNIAITLFIFNLVFNVFWSFLFFKKKMPDVAIMLMGVIIGTVVQIMRFTTNTTVYYLMFPYLTWVTFAACLNYDTLERLDTCNHYITE